MQNTQVLIRLAAVMALSGLSRSAIYADKTFPRAVPLGARSVAWVQSEVEAWIANRIAGREASLAARSEAGRRMRLGKKDRTTESLAA